MRDARIPRLVLAWVAGTVIVGATLSGLAAWRQARLNAEQGQRAFAALAELVAGQLSDRMQLYEKGLRGARGAVVIAGEQRLSRLNFRQYSETRDIDTEFPGARGIGFIRLVPRSQEQQFLLAARRDGWPGSPSSSSRRATATAMSSSTSSRSSAALSASGSTSARSPTADWRRRRRC